MPSAGPSRRPQRKKRRNNRADEKKVEECCGEEFGRDDLSLWCQSRMAEGGIVPPHSVLAPGTALGLLRSRALPSAQVGVIVGASRELSNRTNQRGEKRDKASARLFDRSC